MSEIPESATPVANLPRVVRTLWDLLPVRRRRLFGGLVALLFLAGLIEMSGMVALFGYVSGLDPHDGRRAGHLARLLRFLLDSDLPQLEYVLVGGGIVVGLLLVKNALSSMVHFSLNRFFMKLNEDVSRRMFEGYLLARFEVFGARGLAEPISRVGKATELLGTCFTSASQILADGAIVLTVALLLFAVDPWITLGAALLFGTAGVLLHASTQRLLTQLGKLESIAGKAAKASLREGFYGLIDGRLNGTRAQFVKGYGQALSKTSLARRRRALLSRVPQSINEILLSIGIVGTVLYITLRDLSIQDALPTLTIFAFAGLRLTAAMSRIAKGLQVIRQKSFDFSRFESDLREVAPEVFHSRASEVPTSRYLTSTTSGKPLTFREALTLEDVSFTYPGGQRPALADVSLAIRPGEMVSFCGPSGGGKSTLLLTLMGMLTPSSGRILVDGTSIFESIPRWHEKLAYVGQHPYLTGSTIRANVAFGHPDGATDDARIWAALEKAQAAEFVRELPKGLDTGLADGGLKLSGGQRQRIVIARALFKDPEILVFDEATAALDNITEREITNAIVGLSRQKTVLCVAHRLSTIRESDRIHFVAGGRITATGSYENLLRESADFRELAEAERKKSSR